MHTPYKYAWFPLILKRNGPELHMLWPMLCEIWLAQQLNFFFWDVEDCYHYKSFFVDYYILYAIFYNWLYVLNTTIIPVFVSSNPLGHFLQFFSVSVWVLSYQLVVVVVESKKGKKRL